METDIILCECAIEDLKMLVTHHEEWVKPIMVKPPAVCMTMIKAEDSVELQPFYLGEALTSTCELIINDKIGYGICLGDDPVRAYCMAFIDAFMQLQEMDKSDINYFLQQQSLLLVETEKIEYNQILRTKVDFKIMEQN
jgi:phosphonate C-P lyase system protein PhnG